jgi:SAM-dependent methyltransferase
VSNEFATLAQHSAEYFGDSRDYWWNDDFLALALRRWSVTGIHTLLDVGCGVGHWGRAWAGLLPTDVNLTGIDREPAWVAKARDRALAAGLGNRCRYQVATAEALPFPDNSYDFVTCQTLLIHVPDVRRVLAELVRVTRPGGIVVAAEPNNAGIPVLEDALATCLSIEETSKLLRFQLMCLHGKSVLGLGDESIGRVLPELFNHMGLEQISVCMNEKVCPLTPPYATPRERAIIEEVTDLGQRDFWIWSRADTTRYFLAGGGDEKEFGPLWCLAKELMRRVVEAMRTQKYSNAGGALFYLIAGKKRGGGGMA